MVGEAPKVEIEVVWEGSICPYCGQERNPVHNMCTLCQKQMTSVVLALCKDLLYNIGNLKPLESGKKKSGGKSDKVDNKDAVKEVELHRVLEHFPYEFVKRTLKFKKALGTEGIWFSHMVAYRFISHIRADKNLAPPMIICDPMYVMIRDQVYEFLQLENPDEDTCEAFNNVYDIPGAGDDARSVIAEMIEELERMKRLKIVRPKTMCQGCGKELDTGRPMCPECEKDEALNNRLAISSGMPQPLLPTGNESAPQPTKMRGMHWKED